MLSGGTTPIRFYDTMVTPYDMNNEPRIATGFLQSKGKKNHALRGRDVTCWLCVRLELFAHLPFVLIGQSFRLGLIVGIKISTDATTGIPFFANRH